MAHRARLSPTVCASPHLLATEGKATSPEAEAAACASGRACVQTHPIKEEQGVLFVWGEGGPAAAAESERQPLPIDDLRAAAEAAGEPEAVFIKPYLRDVPTDYLTVVEQALDPSHVDWAHHMIQGDRRGGQGPTTVLSQRHQLPCPLHVPRITAYGQWETTGRTAADAPSATGARGTGAAGSASGSNGAADASGGMPADARAEAIATMQWVNNMSKLPMEVELLSPAHQRYIQRLPSGAVMTVVSYHTPIRPGWTRGVVIGQVFGAGAPLPYRILAHALLMNPTTDGDLVLLHAAEQRARTAARAGGEAADSSAWRRSYYLPTGADRMVSAFRRFVEGRGGHGPWGAPLAALPDYTPLITDRRQLLDRSALHTAHCAACKQVRRCAS
eukprot:scaffold318.g5142.t1